MKPIHFFPMIAAVAAAAACSGHDFSPLEPAVLEARSARFEENRYPTLQEWQAAGGPASYITENSFSSAFSGYNFNANASITFFAVNSYNAAISATVVSGTGGQVGYATGSTRWSGFIPLFSPLTKSIAASATTNNQVCGLSGTPVLSTAASLFVAIDASPFQLWSGGETKTGTVKVQPPCGSGGGGGGGESGGGWCEGTVVCQQWFWYENGEIVDEWWECWCEAAQ